MNQKSLSNWLKGIIIATAIVGLGVYGLILPEIGKSLVEQAPEYEYCFRPWLIFLLTTGIPCFLVLFHGWGVAGNIGKNKSFSIENAKHLKSISMLALVDTGYLFVGNIVFLLLDMNHPGIMIVSLIIIVMGIVFSVAAAALSHLIEKAAKLQDESDLTI